MSAITVRNPLKQKLAAGHVAPGLGIRTVRTGEIARILKTAGFDWMFIDLEHGPTSVESAYGICVAGLDAGIAPIVRVPQGDLKLGARCLDSGALGIVMPHVDTADEAREIVSAYRFAPLGRRSIAGGYAQFGFAGATAKDTVAALNDATLVVVMIETPLAVQNADAIAAVPGVDALLVGSNDLCLEMGIPGQIDNPALSSALETVVTACRKHGKWPGLGGVYQPDLMRRYIGLGMRLILSGSDLSMLLAAATERAAFVNGCA